MKSILETMFANTNYNRDPWGGAYGPTPGGGPVGPVLHNFRSNAPLNTAKLYPNENMEVDLCGKMHGWQQQLAGMLNSNDDSGRPRDIYILSQPGSGKTLPVICYWVNNILQISTSQPPEPQHMLRLLTEPQNIPQVLWLVPIKNLCANIEQEMVERFTTIILQILNRTCHFDALDPNNSNVRTLVFNRGVSEEYYIGTIIRSMSNFGGGQIRDLLLSMINNNEVQPNMVAEFKTNLGILVKNYVENALIGRKEDMVNSIKINNRSELKPFIISIYESAGGIIGNMNRLRLIVFDEAQRLQGGSEADDTRAAQIGDNVHKMLFHNNGRNARIAMLSGSVSPGSARNAMHFFNMAYKRNFEAGPYQTPGNVTNAADIRVFPMSHLDDKFTQLRIINTALAGGNIRQTGIVFVIFGKKRINELIDELASSEIGRSSPGKNLQVTRGSLYSRKDVPMLTDPGDINNIDDERLKRAASNGLGYLYRPEQMTPRRQHDTIIIQRLFKDGIIKVLLVTDAVREGINITCNEMYIPSILLPPDNREMDSGSLAQLINRVGRKEGKYATIYTDSRYVGKISSALSNDPNRFEDQPFSLPGSWITKTGSPKTEIMLNYGANITADVAVSIGRGIMRVFS